MLGGSTLITRSGFPGSAVVYIAGQAGACCAPTQAGVFEVGSFSISFETAYQAAFGIMIGGAGNTLHGPGMSVLRDINIEGPQYGVFAYASGVGSTLDRIAMHRIQVTAQPSSSTFTYGMLLLATNGGVIGELNCYDVQLDISRNSAGNSTAFRILADGAPGGVRSSVNLVRNWGLNLYTRSNAVGIALNASNGADVGDFYAYNSQIDPGGLATTGRGLEITADGAGSRAYNIVWDHGYVAATNGSTESVYAVASNGGLAYGIDISRSWFHSGSPAKVVFFSQNTGGFIFNAHADGNRLEEINIGGPGVAIFIDSCAHGCSGDQNTVTAVAPATLTFLVALTGTTSNSTACGNRSGGVIPSTQSGVDLTSGAGTGNLANNLTAPNYCPNN